MIILIKRHRTASGYITKFAKLMHDPENSNKRSNTEDDLKALELYMQLKRCV